VRFRVDSSTWGKFDERSAVVPRRARSRQRLSNVIRLARSLFERTTDARARGTLDLISKDVVPHADVVPSPANDARPGQAAKEAPARLPPSRARYQPSDHPRKGAQETLKRVAAPRANEQVQVRAHVGIVIDTDSEAIGHLSKRATDGGRVPEKVPRPAGALARENDMHGAARADRALELATAASDGAAVVGS
jgi:hypothetical protein